MAKISNKKTGIIRHALVISCDLEEPNDVSEAYQIGAVVDVDALKQLDAVNASMPSRDDPQQRVFFAKCTTRPTVWSKDGQRLQVGAVKKGDYADLQVTACDWTFKSRSGRSVWLNAILVTGEHAPARERVEVNPFANDTAAACQDPDEHEDQFPF